MASAKYCLSALRQKGIRLPVFITLRRPDVTRRSIAKVNTVGAGSIRVVRVVVVDVATAVDIANVVVGTIRGAQPPVVGGAIAYSPILIRSSEDGIKYGLS